MAFRWNVILVLSSGVNDSLLQVTLNASVRLGALLLWKDQNAQ